MDKQTTYKASQRGVALVFALLSILVLSILAVAIMSTSMAQTWTAFDYRLTAQARYSAEAGIQETMNWLSSASYTTPHLRLVHDDHEPRNVPRQSRGALTGDRILELSRRNRHRQLQERGGREHSGSIQRLLFDHR